MIVEIFKPVVSPVTPDMEWFHIDKVFLNGIEVDKPIMFDNEKGYVKRYTGHIIDNELEIETLYGAISFTLKWDKIS